MDLLKVIKAEYLSKYKISVTFNTGHTLICDLADTLELGVFRDLKNVDRFKEFTVNEGVIEWMNDIDIAPEFLYKIGIPLPGKNKPLEPEYVRWVNVK